MATSFLAFDLEIARNIADFSQWRKHRPLGITCAATLDETDQLTLWYSLTPDGSPAPQMTSTKAHELLVFLSLHHATGRPIVTWNGAAFDFDILAEEAGDSSLAADVAFHHVDLMLAFVAVRGHRLSLARAAEACGSHKGVEGVSSGADAPILWKNGQYDLTLAYLEQDVRVTAAVTRHLMAHQGFTWTSSSGNRQEFTLPNHVCTLTDLSVASVLGWPPLAPSRSFTPLAPADHAPWLTKSQSAHQID